MIGSKFNVKLNNCVSKLNNVTNSVPQGSTLGPFIHIIYANDITELFNFTRMKMYADDLTIFAYINNEKERVKFQK